MIGFCVAPARARASISTTDSATVGSCQDTTSSLVTPRPAATDSAASRRPAALNERPCSSESSTRSGWSSAAASTSDQIVGIDIARHRTAAPTGGSADAGGHRGGRRPQRPGVGPNGRPPTSPFTTTAAIVGRMVRRRSSPA